MSIYLSYCPSRVVGIHCDTVKHSSKNRFEKCVTKKDSSDGRCAKTYSFPDERKNVLEHCGKRFDPNGIIRYTPCDHVVSHLKN